MSISRQPIKLEIFADFLPSFRSNRLSSKCEGLFFTSGWMNSKPGTMVLMEFCWFAEQRKWSRRQPMTWPRNTSVPFTESNMSSLLMAMSYLTRIKDMSSEFPFSISETFVDLTASQFRFPGCHLSASTGRLRYTMQERRWQLPTHVSSGVSYYLVLGDSAFAHYLQTHHHRAWWRDEQWAQISAPTLGQRWKLSRRSEAQTIRSRVQQVSYHYLSHSNVWDLNLTTIVLDTWKRRHPSLASMQTNLGLDWWDDGRVVSSSIVL